MKTLKYPNPDSFGLKRLVLAVAAGAVFLAGNASADTTITNGQTATVTGDPVASFFSTAGTVTMDDGATLQCPCDQNSLPAGAANAGWNIDNAIIFSGNAGTINLKFNDNDTYWNFNGPITGTASGAQTLAVTTGFQGNGDREAVNFTTAIPDGSSGAIGLQIAHNVQSGGNTYVNLIAVNTFTGPITVTAANNVATGYLVVGGERYERAFDGSSPYGFPGSGSLGNGNYPGTISLGDRTALDYYSSADQTLSGVISGTGKLIKDGSGTLTLSGLNTYTSNTTVNSGTLVLANSGGMTFSLTDLSSNKITGAGTATLNGALDIDTSAVTVATGSWTLVDVATKTYGGTFSVTGFSGPVAGVWTKVVGAKTWTFDQTTGMLSVSGPALITSFSILGYSGVIDNNALTVRLSVPGGADLTNLVPTYTVSSGTGDPASGVSHSFSSPATYTITDGAAVNAYTVTVSYFAGLNVSTYFVTADTSLLNPISNLMELTPSATGIQVDNIDYHGGTWGVPGSPSGDNFEILWEGYVDVLAAGGHGVYTFGTSSDDGSRIFMDLNGDGVFTSDEMIVDNNNFQPDTAITGQVTLNQDSVHVVIGYYEGGGGYDMRAAWKKGEYTNFNDLDLINGTSGAFFPTDPHPATAHITSFAVSGHAFAVNQTTNTIAVSVPYGTDLATLAPTFTLSSGTCDQTSGSPPSPTFASANPVTYTVTDGATVNAYIVTVTVLAQPPPTTTIVYNLGTSPEGTFINNSGAGGLFIWIAKGALPAGSILRAVTATNVKVEQPNGSENWASDLGLFLDPTPETPGGPDGVLKISDDGDFGGATTSINWKGQGQDDGPMTVTLTAGVDFPDTIDLNTVAVMLGSAYGSGTWSGTITLTYDGVGPSGDYSTWLGGFTFAPGADTSATGDPDGDGMTNFEEYAFGLDPTQGSSVNPITMPLDKTGTFSYTRRATPATTGITYTVSTSTDLVTWTPDAGSAESTTTSGNVETVTFTVTALPADGKLFVRVEATPAP